METERSSRAQAVLFGFDFQVNAAIILMLENIRELQTLRLEGNLEDIELEINNSECILAQAKSVEKSSTDFNNVRANLKKALTTLSKGAQKANARQLILITNSPDPLHDESRNLFTEDAHRPFSSLPPSSQELIRNYLKSIENPLDTDKFMIQILPFETDLDSERYKYVKRSIDDFIGELNINIPGIGKKLLTIWHDDIFNNGSKKDEQIKLHKRDIIWPILVIATNNSYCDNEFADQFDTSLYDEIVRQYSELIDTCCERYEFFIRVLSDYNDFTSSKKQREKAVDFAMNKWEDYLSDLKLEYANEEVQRGLIQIVLYSIVRNRITIDNVKRGVGL